MVCHLGGTGLAAHLNGETGKIAGSRTVLGNDALHALFDGFQGGGRDLHGVEHGGLGLLVHLGIGIVHDLFQQVGPVAGAAVYQRGHIICQLQGRKLVVRLADGGHQGVGGVPFFAVVGRAGFWAGQVARRFAGKLHAGLFPQAQLPGVAAQRLDAQLVAHLIEKVVAGIFQRLADIDAAVRPAVLAVDPAPGGIAHIGIALIDTLVQDLGVGGDAALLQRRQGGAHLEGGAGGVVALDGPVIEGVQLVGLIHAVIRAEGGQAVGGPAGHGQDLSGVYVDDHRCAAGHIRPGAVLAGFAPFLDGGQGVRQGLLHPLLQRQIQGQVAVFAGLGLFHHIFRRHLSGAAVHLHCPQAVGAPEILLQRLLHAVLADGVGEGIALVLVRLIFLPGDGGHPAQHMGRGAGVVFPAAGHLDGHPRQLAGLLRDPGHRADVHLLRQGDGSVVGGKLVILQIIAHADDRPALLQRQIRIHPVPAAQQAEQPVGGQVLHLAPFPGVGKFLQFFAVAAVQGGPGICQRRFPGQGQDVAAGDAVLPQRLPKLQDHLVLLLFVPFVIVQLHRKAQGVIHHHPAVPVQDLPPGGQFIIVADDVGIEALGGLAPLNELQLNEPVDQRAEDGEHTQAQGDDTGSPGLHEASSVKRRWTVRSSR